MSGLVLENLTKRFGSLPAVDAVDLQVPHGTFVCLLGPSGCGKSTLLRLIAGLEAPTAGRILIDGTDITGIEAHRRDFGMVFQSLALFPHLSVGDNIAYPLRIRAVAKPDQRARVAELLDLVHLPGFADRPVATLSGGQRQRVAIARALALSPQLFLLDEPLSALDAKLREAMQLELRQLQERLGITTIVVTHDQREAMTMADLVVVMGEGRIRQAGSPVDIYRRPSDSFVAAFIGMTNLLPAHLDFYKQVSVPGGTLPGVQLPSGTRNATVSIRPEDVRIVPVNAGTIRGRVSFVRDLGASIEVFIEAGEREIVAALSPRGRVNIQPGAQVGLQVAPEACVVLPS